MNFTKENQTDKPCRDLYIFFERYVFFSLTILNLIFNSLNIIIFKRLILIQKNKSDLYKYLLIKSVSDGYFGLRFFIEGLILFYNPEKKFKDFSSIMFYLISIYLGHVAQLISKVSECFGCFDKLLIFIFCLNNSKTNRIIKCLFVVLITFCILFPTYKFGEYQIEKSGFNTYNSSAFSYQLKNYSQENNFLATLKFIHSLFRDIIFLTFSFNFNMATFIFMRKSLEKRKSLLNGNKKQTKVLNYNHKDFQIIIMISITTIISLIGHLSSFLSLVEPKIFDNYCINTFSLGLVYESSYAFDLVIYLIFNRNFRLMFLNYLHLKKLSVEPANDKNHTIK